MRKWFYFLLLLPILACCSCEGEQILNEDWDQYADVFSGPGPEEDFEKLFIKLDYDRFGNITGEMEGPFYARVTGAFVLEGDVREVSLDAMFRSAAYYGFTRVHFEGFVQDEILSGTLSYTGVEVYQYFYEGRRVGGCGQ